MNFDYIIVGARVVGSSIAYYLKSELLESNILLLDRNYTAGAGNTVRSATLYRNFFSLFTSRMLKGSSIKYYLELGEGILING